jgi:cobalt-zinc-cadmium efflux system outer membrane protein
MKRSNQLVPIACILLIAGCAQTRVASRTATTADRTVADIARDSDSDSADAGSQRIADAGGSIEQTAFRQLISIDEPAPAVAETGEATLDSLEQLALSSNPTLAELQAKVRAANGRWLQVGLKPNPLLAYSGQEIGNNGKAGQQGAFLQQEFVTANKLQLNRNAATWNVKRAEQEFASQQLRVLTDVRQGFYSTRVAQERVKIAEELHGIAQKAVEKAKELVKLQEPKTVLTQAEIEAELAALLVENSRTQREAQWRKLAAVIGQPDMPSQVISGELTADAPQVVWEKTLERIQRESPEVAAAVSEVEQTRWALQRASVQATPNVTIQAGALYDYSTRDPVAMLQVSLPIPIYNRNQGGIAEAHANVVAAEQSVQRVELSLQRRLAAVYQQYEQARQQASRYDSVILKKAKDNLELNRKTYEAGESAYLAVLTAQRSYSQARLAWLNALEQLWSATVLMEGLLLSDSLKN